MTNNVIEKVLGDNAFYTSDYIKETINLTKSIVVKNDTEARRYNDYIKVKYPLFLISDYPEEWRYYLHLIGKLHVLDKPVMVTSVDNGDVFELTKASVFIHRRTRAELLKFGLFYDELIKVYPEQELYIKSIITTSVYLTIEEIIALDDYKIVSYNDKLIEENEHDVIFETQVRIDNYKHIWLLPYYSLSSDLFLASQYHILYYFILTSIMGIRFENAKTSKAHTYHIRSYLASHHNLDQHLLFLTRKQQLFLYRNMLYLNNHCGVNSVFQKLIDVLFTDRNISVVNYVQHQQNTITSEGDTNYTYNQVLLNSKKLGYDKLDKSLDFIKYKEYKLAPGNAAVYDREIDDIDRKNRLMLTSKILTKDLETILIDETDTVKHKLLDVLTDYWAYLVKTEQMSFLVDLVDPVSNNVRRLNTRDLFKAYVICLFRSQGYNIDTFPEYRIKRVFKQTLPTRKQLLGFFYDRRIVYSDYIDDILRSVPAYRYLSTSYEFSEFITQIYNLNIGHWALTSNYSDIHTYGQISASIELMHQNQLFVYDDETVDEFIERVGIKDVRKYTPKQASTMVFSILDNVFDQNLTYHNRLKLLQKSLGEVFFKFNSYTVQLINNYYADNAIVAGTKDSRYHHKYKITINSVEPILNIRGLTDYMHELIIETTGKLQALGELTTYSDFDSKYILKSLPFFVITSEMIAVYTNVEYHSVDLSKTLIVLSEQIDKIVVQADLTQALNFYDEGVKLHSNIDFVTKCSVSYDVKTTVTMEGEIGSVTYVEADDTSPSVQFSDPHLAFLAMNL